MGLHSQFPWQKLLWWNKASTSLVSLASALTLWFPVLMSSARRPPAKAKYIDLLESGLSASGTELNKPLSLQVAQLQDWCNGKGRKAKLIWKSRRRGGERTRKSQLNGTCSLIPAWWNPHLLQVLFDDISFWSLLFECLKQNLRYGTCLPYLFIPIHYSTF